MNLNLFHKISILISSLIYLNCYIHHANVSGDLYGMKEIVKFTSNDYKGTLPVRIEFDAREKENVSRYLAKKGQNIKISENLIQSYYSEEIISKFRNSKIFEHNPDANIKIRIFAYVEEVRDPVITFIANIVSLGIFPAITRSYGRLEFEIFDSQNHKILKSFKYPIEHRQSFSFSSILIGPILPLFSERFDHSQNEKNYAIMRVAFKQFEIDLANNLNLDKNLSARFFVDASHKYAILPFEPSKSPEKEIYGPLYSNLESSFLARGLLLVERAKLNTILNEIILSKSGLTESKRLEVGKILNADRLINVSDLMFSNTPEIKKSDIAFSIQCLDVESGKILWSERLRYQSSAQESVEKLIESAVHKLISELKSKGSI